MARFHDDVRQMLEARGWTGAQLAREAGLSPTTVQKYRTAEGMPRLEHLERLIAALQVPHDVATI